MFGAATGSSAVPVAAVAAAEEEEEAPPFVFGDVGEGASVIINITSGGSVVLDSPEKPVEAVVPEGVSGHTSVEAFQALFGKTVEQAVEQGIEEVLDDAVKETLKDAFKESIGGAVDEAVAAHSSTPTWAWLLGAGGVLGGGVALIIALVK
ncbi:MAG: hypothetical protein FWD30_03720 [Dehalococcoidia bacterium]|nr:hypothetical protein [Dehalococcoidia bacterium]